MGVVYAVTQELVVGVKDPKEAGGDPAFTTKTSTE